MKELFDKIKIQYKQYQLEKLYKELHFLTRKDKIVDANNILAVYLQKLQSIREDVKDTKAAYKQIERRTKTNKILEVKEDIQSIYEEVIHYEEGLLEINSLYKELQIKINDKDESVVKREMVRVARLLPVFQELLDECVKLRIVLEELPEKGMTEEEDKALELRKVKNKALYVETFFLFLEKAFASLIEEILLIKKKHAIVNEMNEELFKWSPLTKYQAFAFLVVLLLSVT